MNVHWSCPKLILLRSMDENSYFTNHWQMTERSVLKVPFKINPNCVVAVLKLTNKNHSVFCSMNNCYMQLKYVNKMWLRFRWNAAISDSIISRGFIGATKVWILRNSLKLWWNNSQLWWNNSWSHQFWKEEGIKYVKLDLWMSPAFTTTK